MNPETEKPQLPHFWHFVWLLFMQPITLHRRLKVCGIENPDESLLNLKYWFAKDETRSVKWQYLKYLMILLFIVMPITSLAIIDFFILLGYPIDFEKWITGIALSVVFGVAGGVAGGVAFGVTVGLTVGMAFGVAFGVAVGVAVGVAFSVAVGMAFSVAGGVAGSLAGSVVVGVVVGVAFGVVGGVAVGVAVGVASIIAICRIFLYPFEIIIQLLLHWLQKLFNRSTLHLVPVLYHDLSYLPHPFLAQHIILAAETEPQLARRVIEACAIAPGQRRAGKTALAHFQAQELLQLAQQQKYAQIVELQGEWLSGVEGAAEPLLKIREVARYLQSAETSFIASHRLEHVEKAQQQFTSLENHLLTDSSPVGLALKNTLPHWQTLIANLLQTTQQQTAQKIANPFRAGNPLSPEYGKNVFRGRTELVQRIEALLFDKSQNNSIALLGPRRSGKTSLLKMLPILLPDVICVFFDLQDNPIDSPASFFKKLAEQAQEQTRRDRRLALPPLPEGTPFEAGSQWLQSLDSLAGQYNKRILIGIDEFERLENVFPGERRELLQLMGLFRATIQHRQHLRLLVSGVATFDELDSLWSDHFINLREVRIGHLDKTTSIELLTHPSPEFPAQAISTEIAATIFERTGGLPYLLQCYGSGLVEHLNEQKRQQADMNDLAIVEQQVLGQATYYFRNTALDAPEPARRALIALAENQTNIEIDKPTRRWLKRRCLLTDTDQLLIPVLGTWIQEEYG